MTVLTFPGKGGGGGGAGGSGFEGGGCSEVPVFPSDVPVSTSVGLVLPSDEVSVLLSEVLLVSSGAPVFPPLVAATFAPEAACACVVAVASTTTMAAKKATAATVKIRKR